MTVLLRLGATSLPAWQHASTLGVLVLSVMAFVRSAPMSGKGLFQYDRAMGLADPPAALAGRRRPARQACRKTVLDV